MLDIPLRLVATPLCVALVIFVLWSLKDYGSRAKNLPPGPSTLPILGNLLDFPRVRPHLTFSSWAKHYGDSFSLRILNKTIIVINTPSLVRELIDRRSASNSNRPKSIIADMITPDNMNMGTGRYANSTWKAMRRASQHMLGPDNIRHMEDFQHAEAVQVMWDFLHTPEDWFDHLRRFTTSFALGLIYGKRGPTLSSPDVVDFMTVHPQFIDALEIGTLPPVDLFPFLTLVPERWASWKTTIRSIRTQHEKLYDRLLTTTEKRLQEGTANGCLMETAIPKAKEWGLVDRHHILHLGGVLLEGSDTSSASLQNVIIALTIYPDVQQRAAAEVSRVVGSSRVPTWDDLPNLPYIRAIIDECNRLRPVGPLGLPHEMMKDEIIDEKLYPKDAAIFINIWGMFHDERYFDQPDVFNPDRFLDNPYGTKKGCIDDPARRPNLLFGGGRRVCPGIAFAKSALEINAANLVWAFEFLPIEDPVSKKPCYPSLDNTTNGVTATPLPTQIRIRPRSEQYKLLIEQAMENAKTTLATFE